ncbi:MAG: TonB-dependent receptor [Saprospiraceae bacterium]|nr:TonB-dependent receptor [Saprospiraceae bacterium]
MAQSLQAQSDSIQTKVNVDPITVIGQSDGLFGHTPGSAQQINKATLHSIAPISGNEVFRTITGIHVVDEEGAGLRLNLGVRGLDPDRSRNVLVLEDGIPVALGPYSEPELYYTPSIERMSGVEVLKGSGQILYGPQTIGGVINYQSLDPPSQGSRGDVRLRVGEGGLLHAHVNFGAAQNGTSYLLQVMRKQADRIGYVGYRIHDLTGKFNMTLHPKSKLSLKISVYDEWSDATYIGLTQSMYDQGDQDFVAMAPDDHLQIRRYAGSLQHTWQLQEKASLKTTLFGYTTTRNWQRQDFSSNPQAGNSTGVVWGDPTIQEGSITMLEGTGHRNRQFEVGGLESRYHVDHHLSGIEQQLDAGARILHERAYEQRVNGTRKDAESGALVQDEIRTGLAGSIFAQNRWVVHPKLSLTTGLRGELYAYQRQILRNTFSGEVRDTNIIGSSQIAEIIPGIGINYSFAPDWTLFTGIHRGFAPPRIKDAITSTGLALTLDAETSWNTEVGIRHKATNWWAMEATIFYMDFANQIIPVSESSGGTGTGLVNGGSTVHYGLECGSTVHLNDFLQGGHQLEIQVSGTLLEATFDADRFIQEGPDLMNIRGNDTPYTPSMTGTGSVRYGWRGQLGVQWTSRYTGSQYTDEVNSVLPSANGRTGQLDAFWVHDLSGWWIIPKTRLEVGIALKNLTNERYIVSRRPQGIRVGLPRYFSASLHYRF